MEPEATLEFDHLARELEAMGVEWLLIGGQAVRLYGGPRPSYDWDIWVNPRDRVRTLTWLRDGLGLELSAEPEEPRPIVKAYAGADRLDIFGVRSLTNLDGVTVTFADAHARSTVLRDPASRVQLRLPCIDDLIALKRMREGQPRDEEDIRFLRVRQDQER